LIRTRGCFRIYRQGSNTRVPSVILGSILIQNPYAISAACVRSSADEDRGVAEETVTDEGSDCRPRFYAAQDVDNPWAGVPSRRRSDPREIFNNRRAFSQKSACAIGEEYVLPEFERRGIDKCSGDDVVVIIFT